jgi:hypothetical protein
VIALATPARFGQLPKLHVYVDETGDRGFSEASRAQSPFFAMTALLIPQEEEWGVKLTAGGLRALVHGAEPQRILKPIHWVEHFKAKRKDRRRQAAHALALMPNAMVIHVIAHKDTVNEAAGQPGLVDHAGGIIPAGAGSRSVRSLRWIATWDHPRGCRVQGAGCRVQGKEHEPAICLRGPSLRVRGAGRERLRPRALQGAIPAGAGSRAARSPAAFVAGD